MNIHTSYNLLVCVCVMSAYIIGIYIYLRMARTRSASFLYFSGFFLYIKMCFSLQPSQDSGFVGLDGKLEMYKTESKE